MLSNSGLQKARKIIKILCFLSNADVSFDEKMTNCMFFTHKH